MSIKLNRWTPEEDALLEQLGDGPATREAWACWPQSASLAVPCIPVAAAITFYRNALSASQKPQESAVAHQPEKVT